MSPVEGVIKQIGDLRGTAGSVDWDSYEALPLDDAQCKQAVDLVRFIDSEYYYAHFPTPLVSPLADPGVALIWRRKGYGEVDALFTPRGVKFVVLSPDRKLITKGSITNYKAFVTEVLAHYLK
jgi:hypothetical protein